MLLKLYFYSLFIIYYRQSIQIIFIILSRVVYSLFINANFFQHFFIINVIFSQVFNALLLILILTATVLISFVYIIVLNSLSQSVYLDSFYMLIVLLILLKLLIILILFLRSRIIKLSVNLGFYVIFVNYILLFIFMIIILFFNSLFSF